MQKAGFLMMRLIYHLSTYSSIIFPETVRLILFIFHIKQLNIGVKNKSVLGFSWLRTLVAMATYRRPPQNVVLGGFTSSILSIHQSVFPYKPMILKEGLFLVVLMYLDGIYSVRLLRSVFYGKNELCGYINLCNVKRLGLAT